MSNGVSAQSGFRYQDWCAIYFLLNNYLIDSQSLEYVICENDKLDFEISLRSQFEGYQVKGGKTLSAQELNELFKFYLEYIQDISKNCSLYLIFTREPIKSFRLLAIKLSGDRSIKIVSRIVNDYFSTALEEIDLTKLRVDYKILSKTEIPYLVFGLTKRILEMKYSKIQDLPPGMIDDFVYRLKDQIEKKSSQEKFEKRRIEKTSIENMINRIISSQVFRKREKSGNVKFVSVNIPVERPLEISIKITPPLKKPKILPPESYE